MYNIYNIVHMYNIICMYLHTYVVHYHVGLNMKKLQFNFKEVPQVENTIHMLNGSKII